ncbi:MAG: zinc ribbon domain-containing protein [Tenuifilaceae bacterium]|jgi:predicted nucleic-acid-binding Zn-ribbon protein|uniref:zinc ribbon domain-containing protein n=1 Tax=Perlabentimonas gracilis TaxID=2715279 RepID=UPI00140864C9|nr:zinc ribbon domain-containing protein [Perlabentimonas gracilis]MDX9770865.1 zinc ribbon domain-containing protein [Tenuifilaceae bacterium]NHB68136.1 GTP-binding protein [Perlabentimonas gracilis]
MPLVRSKQPCPKCGSKDFELGEAYIAGSMLTRIFNIQNRKFSSFTCVKCRYTEFYQVPMRKAMNVLDFFVG